MPLLALALALASCGDDTTTLRVDVRTDYVPGVEFAEVEVGFDSGGIERTYPVRFGEDFLTGIRVAVLEDAPVGQVVLRARLNAADGRRIAERRLELDLRGPANTITVVFTRACASISCPDGDDPSATECVGGRCVSPECSPEDVGSCGTGCASADDCSLMVAGCARAICDEGICFVGSEVGACAINEFCHPERGCTPEPVTMDGAVPPIDAGVDASTPPDMAVDPSCGEPCDTGAACEEGVFDCSSGAPVCTPTGPSPSGTQCRAAAGDCDEPEACDGSSTACPTDDFAPTGTTCAGGFCDGLGSCGACEPGAACSTGNPCEVGAIQCVGGEPSCVKSSDVSAGTSCGATMTGAWGSCGGFSNDCDTTGTQSRSETVYTCNGSGTCQGATGSEQRGCMRVTGGDPCGAVRVEGGFGSCGGFSTSCDESGTRSQTVTTYACDATGSCIGTDSTESVSCARDTDGEMCAATTFGSWGSCLIDTSSNPCNEDGVQSRTVTSYSCGSGSCQSSASSQTQPCTSSSAGRICPNPYTPPQWECAKFRCSGGSCLQSGDFCLATEQCCEFGGCQPDGGFCAL